MEQLDRIIDEDNKLTLFFHETKGMIILDKILKYILSLNYKYSYIVFGYSSNEFDMSFYSENYPELVTLECGAIRLKDEDRSNILLIYDVLNNYSTASLYINNEPDMLDNFNFDTWLSNSNDLKYGYAISDMVYEYLTVRKAPYIKDWSLESMGISSVSLEQQNLLALKKESKEKRSLIGKFAIIICIAIAFLLLYKTIANLLRY